MERGCRGRRGKAESTEGRKGERDRERRGGKERKEQACRRRVWWVHPLDTEYQAVNPGPGAWNKGSKLLRPAAGAGGGR